MNVSLGRASRQAEHKPLRVHARVQQTPVEPELLMVKFLPGAPAPAEVLACRGEMGRRETEVGRGQLLSLSVVSDSLQLHGLWPTRLLSPWDFPGK